MFLPWIFCGRFFVLHSFLCKEHKNQKGDMTFCVVYTEICVSLRLVTTKSVWKYRTEWNFEKRISDSGPSKHAWILVYSSRIKFYSHPQNPGNVPCKLHEKPCKVHGFRCSLHTSRTCTYCYFQFLQRLRTNMSAENKYLTGTSGDIGAKNWEMRWGGGVSIIKKCLN